MDLSLTSFDVLLACEHQICICALGGQKLIFFFFFKLESCNLMNIFGCKFRTGMDKNPVL